MSLLSEEDIAFFEKAVDYTPEQQARITRIKGTNIPIAGHMYQVPMSVEEVHRLTTVDGIMQQAMAFKTHVGLIWYFDATINELTCKAVSLNKDEFFKLPHIVELMSRIATTTSA